MSLWRELRIRIRGPLHGKIHRAAEAAGLPVPEWHRRTLAAAVRDPAEEPEATADERISLLTTKVQHLESIVEGLREENRRLQPFVRLGRVLLREARSFKEH